MKVLKRCSYIAPSRIKVDGERKGNVRERNINKWPEQQTQ